MHYQEADLHRAVLDAYDRDTLERLLYFTLGRRLDEIAGEANFPATVYDVIRAANRSGWLDAFINAVIEGNPGNPLIEAFAKTYLTVGATIPDRGEGVGELRKVFVVYGRNDKARRAMFDFLRSIGLFPIEWSQARAATGKAMPYVGEILDAALAIARAVVILLTPDETVSLREEYASGSDDPEVGQAFQARPNVLFEAGLAMGRAPDQTILVQMGNIRPFSDIAGRHVVRLRDTVASRQELALRLQSAGCSIDLSGTDWHEVGDFSAPE